MLLPPWCLCLSKFFQRNRSRKKSFFLPIFVPSFLLLSSYLSKWSLSWGIGSQDMEAEKTHDLPSAIWRPSQVGGIIQLESEGLRPRGADDINLSLGTWDDELSCLSSRNKAREKEANSTRFCFLFYSDPQWMGWSSTTWRRAIYWVHQFKWLISSGNSLTDTPRNSVWSGHLSQVDTLN